MRKLVFCLLVSLTALTSYAQQVPSAPTLPAGSEPTPQTTPESGSAPALRTCPLQTSGAFTATALICESLGDGEVCIGNGIIEATPREGVSDFSFGLPQERTTITNLAELRLRTLDTENGLWSVVTGRHTLSTTANNVASANMIVFGDVTLDDDGDIARQVDNGVFSGTVIADFGMNIRRGPDANAGIAQGVQTGAILTVTGVTADRVWYRVEIPSGFGGSGWVYAPYIELSGNVSSLPVVTQGSPAPTSVAAPSIEFGTMQAFNLISANTDPTCTDTPDSGVLLQSPNGVPDSLRLRVNDVEIEFSGTVFLQAQANVSLRVSVLEGEARVFTPNGANASAFSNQVLTVSMGANLEPTSDPATGDLDTSRLTTLPFSLLPRPIVVAGVVSSTPVSSTVVPEATSAETAATPLPVDATLAPTIPPTPTIASVGSFSSDDSGELCGASAYTLEAAANPNGFTSTIGGIWSATSGTTITVEILGGTFQSALGSFIVLNSTGGVIATSGDNASLTYTFTQDTRFGINVSSRVGDSLIFTARCGG
jgi:hypothetical protein